MRYKIINSASVLFTEKGVEKTSLAEISKHAKISKGTLYYYFQTKNDLVFAVAENYINKLTENLLELLNKLEKDPYEIMEDLYSRVTSDKIRSRLHIYLVREAITNSPDLLEKFQSIYSVWEKNIMVNIEKFFPSIEDCNAMSRFVIASIDGLLIQNILGITPLETKRYIKLLKNLNHQEEKNGD